MVALLVVLTHTLTTLPPSNNKKKPAVRFKQKNNYKSIFVIIDEFLIIIHKLQYISGFPPTGAKLIILLIHCGTNIFWHFLTTGDEMTRVFWQSIKDKVINT